jgi:hypothetical protein
MAKVQRRSDRGARARVARRVRLGFDEFGWESLESEAARNGEPLDQLLARAAAYLDAELRSTRPAVLVPKFKPGGHGSERELELELTQGCWERLENEAERQEVSLERLLEHAALFHLADADSGRVAERLVGEVEEPEASG